MSEHERLAAALAEEIRLRWPLDQGDLERRLAGAFDLVSEQARAARQSAEGMTLMDLLPAAQRHLAEKRAAEAGR